MALISATRASTLNNVITHSFHPVESKNNTTQNTVTRYVPWYSWPTQLYHFLFLFTMDGGKVQMIDRINADVLGLGYRLQRHVWEQGIWEVSCLSSTPWA